MFARPVIVTAPVEPLTLILSPAIIDVGIFDKVEPSPENDVAVRIPVTVVFVVIATVPFRDIFAVVPLPAKSFICPAFNWIFVFVLLSVFLLIWST